MSSTIPSKKELDEALAQLRDSFLEDTREDKVNSFARSKFAEEFAAYLKGPQERSRLDDEVLGYVIASFLESELLERSRIRSLSYAVVGERAGVDRFEFAPEFLIAGYVPERPDFVFGVHISGSLDLNGSRLKGFKGRPFRLPFDEPAKFPDRMKLALSVLARASGGIQPLMGFARPANVTEFRGAVEQASEYQLKLEGGGDNLELAGGSVGLSDPLRGFMAKSRFRVGGKTRVLSPVGNSGVGTYRVE
jgi:hypothetical protein